jgi:hypothetical protein
MFLLISFASHCYSILVFWCLIRFGELKGNLCWMCCVVVWVVFLFFLHFILPLIINERLLLFKHCSSISLRLLKHTDYYLFWFPIDFHGKQQYDITLIPTEDNFLRCCFWSLVVSGISGKFVICQMPPFFKWSCLPFLGHLYPLDSVAWTNSKVKRICSHNFCGICFILFSFVSSSLYLISPLFTFYSKSSFRQKTGNIFFRSSRLRLLEPIRLAILLQDRNWS